MKTVKVELSDDVLKVYQEKAKENGYGNSSVFIQFLLETLAEELEKDEDLSDEEKIAQRLRGLGYI